MNNVKHKQPLKRWESTLNQFYWLLLLLRQSQFGTLVRRRVSRLKDVALQVAQVIRASSLALNVNHRLCWAIVFMLIVAPSVNVGYQLFEHDAVVEGWYYNHFYFFYVLAPWMSLLCFSTGLFLLFPQGNPRSFFLVIPVASAVVKILWLSQVTSNEEFHEMAPRYFYLPALLIAFMYLFVLDWMLDRKFHKHDGIIARIEGLLRIKADHSLIEKELKELQSFQTKY